jgi:RNA polymerase sigma factor (sigma-70 family)
MTAAATDPTPSSELAPLQRIGFEELCRTKYTPMVRLAYVLVDTIGDAEHVVQDAFVALYRRYDTVLAPEAYLRTSVINGSRKLLRRRRVVRRHPIDPPGSGELEFNHVFDAVRRLPVGERVLVALRYEQHLTDSEIAAAMSMPIGTVKSRLHRALGALRKEIT